MSEEVTTSTATPRISLSFSPMSIRVATFRAQIEVATVEDFDLQSVRASPADLNEAHDRDRLAAELTQLRRYGLIIIDEVGHLPFEQDAANLFFLLVSFHYGHASLILTSNLPSSF